MPSFPPRLHVLLARDAPVGLVLRRGPSKAVCAIGWDRKRDRFEVGQWLRGRIYERRSDLSPDGKHVIYFAMNGRWTTSRTKGSWTAVSRARFRAEHRTDARPTAETIPRGSTMSHPSFSGHHTMLAPFLLSAAIPAMLALGSCAGLPEDATDSVEPAITAYPNPGRVTGSTGAHDPSVVKTPNGTYIVAATGNNLVLKTSSDRIAWRNAGAVWPNGAPWTLTYTGGSRTLWAPDISFHNGQYYLYYAASTFGSQRSAIFLATSPTAASGSWTDRGLVIESSTAVNYNAIDPNLLIDAQGQWWLTFGSFWTGIKLIRLDPATGKRSTSDTAVRPLAQRFTASGSVEAPFVFRHNSMYYAFVSFDFCCQGAASTYRVMVGRSASITGPYVDRAGVALTSGGGTEILAGHGSIHGPGHQAVITDVDGDILVYHYYADSGASFLGINRLDWDTAGWPFVF